MEETDRRPKINQDNEWARFAEKGELSQSVPKFPQGPISLAQVKAIRRGNARRAINP